MIDKTIVLLHGWGMNNAIWDQKFLTELIWNTELLELPGHGLTQDLMIPPDLSGWADYCLKQAPQQAIWLGWSLGGLIAIEAALRAPQRILGLILLTTTPKFTRTVDSFDWPAKLSTEILTDFHAELSQDPQKTLLRFLTLQVQSSETGRDTLRCLRQLITQYQIPNLNCLKIGLEILNKTDLRAQLAKIKCPTLWLFGSHDNLVSPKIIKQLEFWMPQALIKIIPGAAHAPQLSHPEKTILLIREFLEFKF